MSYTLRGRVDSRLAAALVPVVAAGILALVLHRWWPVEVAGLMVAVGLALDLLLYDRVIDYQPGWLALPLGALELGLVTALVYATGVRAPLGSAIAFFVGSWALAQVLGQAVYPGLRLSYADDGGELGRSGVTAATAFTGLFLAAGAVAFATQPPTVTLAGGVHRGPIVITHSEVLTGKPGAVVRGGIVVHASDVTIRNLTVLGGTNGIDIQYARRVKIENVRVAGASLDGIHVLFGQVMVHDCAIVSSGPYTQAVDISYSMDWGMSAVEDCDVSGGQEGIVTHSSMVMVSGNHVHGTGLRGITMTEMSMGEVSKNTVTGTTGVGVYCGDHSQCEINRNIVEGTRSAGTDDLGQAGIGIEAKYYAVATLGRNVLVDNPEATAAFSNSLFQSG
jgi:Right handed beta helix region